MRYRTAVLWLLSAVIAVMMAISGQAGHVVIGWCALARVVAEIYSEAAGWVSNGLPRSFALHPLLSHRRASSTIMLKVKNLTLRRDDGKGTAILNVSIAVQLPLPIYRSGNNK